MRIRCFGLTVDYVAKPHKLTDCTVVVDAHCFLYTRYKESGLRYELGAECDRYADYLKEYLGMFKAANIKCIFIFKGGVKDHENKIKKFEDVNEGRTIFPIFVHDIHIQVLREMEYDCFFAEYECKSECIALARKLCCPVLGMNVEFSFSGVQYVPFRTLNCDDDKILTCKLYYFDNLLETYNLDRNKVTVFILLTDENIFPRYSFDIFFKFNGIPIYGLERNVALLRHLSKFTEEQILKDIIEKTTFSEHLIHEKLNEVKIKLNGENNGEVDIDCLLYKRKFTNWFTNGIALEYVATPYINLFRHKVFLVQQKNSYDHVKLSLRIIKYAYDLLTAFKNDGFKFTVYTRDRLRSIDIKDSIVKPTGQTDISVFQNGWNNIRSLGLFEHFLKNDIDFNCRNLETVPDDAKMLMITLTYTFRKSNKFTAEMAHAILLSYVMLGVVNEGVVDVEKNIFVTKSDCESASSSLKQYFNVNKVSEIVDKDILDPLMEFQYCLEQMNYLNKLCGSPYNQTIYRKTCNATFIYKFVYTMQDEDLLLSVNRILSSAPTVLQCYNYIVGLYNRLVNGK